MAYHCYISFGGFEFLGVALHDASLARLKMKLSLNLSDPIPI